MVCVFFKVPTGGMPVSSCCLFLVVVIILAILVIQHPFFLIYVLCSLCVFVAELHRTTENARFLPQLALKRPQQTYNQCKDMTELIHFQHFPTILC